MAIKSSPSNQFPSATRHHSTSTKSHIWRAARSRFLLLFSNMCMQAFLLPKPLRLPRNFKITVCTRLSSLPVSAVSCKNFGGNAFTCFVIGFFCKNYLAQCTFHYDFVHLCHSKSNKLEVLYSLVQVLLYRWRKSYLLKLFYILKWILLKLVSYLFYLFSRTSFNGKCFAVNIENCRISMRPNV